MLKKYTQFSSRLEAALRKQFCVSPGTETNTNYAQRLFCAMRRCGGCLFSLRHEIMLVCVRDSSYTVSLAAVCSFQWNLCVFPILSTCFLIKMLSVILECFSKHWQSIFRTGTKFINCNVQLLHISRISQIPPFLTQLVVYLHADTQGTLYGVFQSRMSVQVIYYTPASHLDEMLLDGLRLYQTRVMPKFCYSQSNVTFFFVPMFFAILYKGSVRVLLCFSV